MADLIYKDLCYQLYGIFYNIQNILGSVHSEKQYQDALEFKLKIKSIKYEREKDLFFEMEGGKIAGNRVDFVINDKVAIDLKTKKYITREDYRQMLRYLKTGKYRLGLIVNFRGSNVIIKRVINSDIRE